MQKNLSFNIDDLDVRELELETTFDIVRMMVEHDLERDKPVSNETLSWIINSPPIYNSIGDDEIKKAQMKHAEDYRSKKKKSLLFVKQMKKEFYDFMCTESKHYKKERESLGGNINSIITGISAALASKLVSVEIGVITTFVTTFLIMLGKMGKRSLCETFKPGE